MAPKKHGTVATRDIKTMLNPVDSLAVKENMKDFLEKTVMHQTLNADLTAAYAYCQIAFKGDAIGKAVPIRSTEEVKSLAIGGGIKPMFSGSLGHLALNLEAIPSNVDSGRIAAALARITVLADLSEVIGTVVINVDVWSADRPDQLQRAQADGEIAAACLLAWKHREHAAETAELKLIFQTWCSRHGAWARVQSLCARSSRSSKSRRRSVMSLA